MPRTTDDYAGQPVARTLDELRTDPDAGLGQAEAETRLERYGPNAIEEKQEPLWHRIFRRFWGPIPWMIEVAALLSAVVHKWEDFAIIVTMLLVNAGLDFLQEHRALNALQALRQRMAREVIVLRDGRYRRLPARELVPGDIIKLKIGDIVPADVQLLDGDYLSIDQSMLTGESLPVSRRRDEVAYANTVVRQGEMRAVVVNTGPRTRFQSVVSLVNRASLEERSHFQKMIISIGNFLILVTIVLVLLIVMVALFRHEPFLEIARFAMVLTVAAIPVALPAVLSVTMAVGAMNLAKRRAIVSKLTAIEELAGVDIFCSDKTGTLTRNEMQVAEPVVFDGHTEEALFLAAVLASREENHDPIETPLFHYLQDHFPGVDWKGWQLLEFTPFDPVRKRTEATLEKDGQRLRAIKGAAQVLLEMVEPPDNERVAITRTVEVLAEKGYRTLAVARQVEDGPLELLGLIPLIDPPREDSAEVIRRMADNGVRVKMVTGDNIAIAREIGRMLGLPPKAMRADQLSGKSGSELIAMAEALTTAIYHRLKGEEVTLKEARRFAGEVMEELERLFDTSLLEREFVHTHESALVEMIEDVDIFAEVVPEDKYSLVETLQKADHIVGMTGDGVNDAPALKKADCGFAVSNATDAARAAADIILTAPGLSVINDALEQARITFERMKSYAIFRIAETIRVLLFMTLAILVFDFYPITAVMIVILALLNDIPILAIAYDRTRVHRKPVRWNLRELTTVASVLGLTGVVSSFLLFFILQERGVAEETIRTVLFLKLIVAGHSTLYITRSEGWFWEKPWPAPILFWATFGTEVLGTLIAVYGWFVTPIGWEYALGVWAYALAWFLVNDAAKMATYRLLRREGFYR
ncbi:MAG TPA: HAD family hydrolase [Thiolapillus brandeum]|uniref:HAD family hydrolase n=1 Tax=Thiolapillus brandeum TaxID=1076588 RepID=A0A7C5IYQ6_9GAMM|nr:HAD family hydrolase [Thiolapillus brandeum]